MSDLVGSGRGSHPFETRPHRTLLVLSLPVMLSLVAEPLAGIVDTAFVERIGAASAAALGAATAILSGIVWVFNFLGVGTQTEIAHHLGDDAPDEARDASSLALMLARALGVLSGLALWPGIDGLAAWMSDDPLVRGETARYLGVRLLGFPAALLLFTAFGALRGLQDMRTPLWVALAMSLANVALDALLVFGAGPVPALGIAGAAWATVASQVVAAGAAVAIVVRRLGFRLRPDPAGARRLFAVGRDMVIRTGMLLLFMLLQARVALQMGALAGAANQAMRQVWTLLAFGLDAWAASAQSLVGYFLGARRPGQARRVARFAMGWGLASGLMLALGLLAAERGVVALLVPPEAVPVFAGAWPVFAAVQPLNAVSFVSDGIHWGTRDYAYLRNAMLCASAGGGLLLWAIEPQRAGAFARLWWAVAVWIALRAGLGWVRIWPGIGRAPLAEPHLC